MKTVLVIFGTRPEAIKMIPVINELKKHSEIRTKVAVTGQHREMLRETLRAFGTVPDYDLGLFKKERSLGDLHATLFTGVTRLLTETRPSLVLVHGDTATAFAAALAAFFMAIPVGHVEAGLRSGRIDAPFPEELNRCAISLLSALDFAPTERAGAVLREMGKCSVFVTGNTVVDALRSSVRADFTHPLLTGTEGKTRLLLTVHRRESLGEEVRSVFRAALRIADRFDAVRVICPLHKNPRVREAAEEVFGVRRHPHVFLCEPLGSIECHNLLARSALVLTDSGGLQEEATALGIPLLILRDVTERQEAVDAGAAILTGTEEERIVSAATELLTDEARYAEMCVPRSLYGDGRAAERIAERTVEFLLKGGENLDKCGSECYNEESNTKT